MTRVGRNLRGFLSAVLAGAFAAAFPALIMSVPLSLSLLFDLDDPNGGLSALPIMLLPLLFTMPCVFGSGIVFGIPVTLVLKALDKETKETYTILGALFGFVPIVIAGLIFSSDAIGTIALLASLGALGGSVTGWIWGRNRDDLNGGSL